MNPLYKETRFRAELPQTGLPDRFGIITAWNPDGRDVSAEANASATERLRSALLKKGHIIFPVTGGSPDFSHAEPGFGVLLESSEETVQWGQRFRQEAVFWVEHGMVRVVSCDNEEVEDIGTWESRQGPLA
jgi:Protein of unknown function (DUF3293)